MGLHSLCKFACGQPEIFVFSVARLIIINSVKIVGVSKLHVSSRNYAFASSSSVQCTCMRNKIACSLVQNNVLGAESVPTKSTVRLLLFPAFSLCGASGGRAIH